MSLTATLQHNRLTSNIYVAPTTKLLILRSTFVAYEGLVLVVVAQKSKLIAAVVTLPADVFFISHGFKQFFCLI